MFTWSAEMRDVFSELSDVKDKMVQLNAKGRWVVFRRSCRHVAPSPS
jgi:hypothetical protein